MINHFSTRNSIRTALLCAGAIVFFVVPAAQSETLEQKVTTLLKPFTGSEVPGAALMVIKDGQVALQKVVGMANISAATPVNERTNFRLASVSKQFTAMAVILLQERQQLSYDDPITRFFPEFPTVGEQMTIRQLLWHTSGVAAYEDLLPEDQTAQLLDKDVLQLVATQQEAFFTPGTEFRYSNTGYSLLALIVEQASGMSFAKFLEENVFKPLGMDQTVAYEQGISNVAHRALGYKQTEDGFVDADQSLTSAVLGDGGVYTSLGGYYAWDQALYTNRLVSKETMHVAFERGRLGDSNAAIDYGFGWRIQDRGGVRVLLHDGRTSGFNNAVRRVPDQRLTVVVLTNRAGKHAGEMADEILDHCLGRS